MCVCGGGGGGACMCVCEFCTGLGIILSVLLKSKEALNFSD